MYDYIEMAQKWLDAVIKEGKSAWEADAVLTEAFMNEIPEDFAKETIDYIRDQLEAAGIELQSLYTQSEPQVEQGEVSGSSDFDGSVTESSVSDLREGE